MSAGHPAGAGQGAGRGLCLKLKREMVIEGRWLLHGCSDGSRGHNQRTGERG